MKRNTPIFLCCLFFFCFTLPLHAADDLPVLVKQLKDPDDITRMKAAKALGKLGAQARGALPALRKAADDDDPDVKSVARQAVKEIIEAVAAEERKESLAALEKNISDAKSDDPKTRAAAIANLTTQVSDVDDVIRLKAIQTLAEVGKDSPEIVQALVDASKSSDDRVRKAAKDALDKLQGPAAKKKREKVDALVKEVKSKDKAARLKAMDDLAAMGPDAKEAGQALVEAMLDKTPVIASKAGDALEKIDPDVYKLVLTLAIDRDARARENAIDSLAKLGTEGRAAVPVLFVASLNVEHASHALQALSKVAPNDARVIDAVLRNLPVAPAEVARGERFITNSGPRGSAIAVLDSVTIPPTKSVPALISAMNDPRVRIDAINALGKIGPKAHEAVPVLSKLKRDASENVRDAAGKALEQIEGK